MLKMFFDGSWSSNSVTLACLAADDPVWIYFDQQWSKLLADRGNPPYMHMKEAMPLVGPFEGWKPDARDFLIQGLIGLLMEIGQHRRFHAFTCTIDLEAHARWQVPKQLPPAARLCARLIFPRVVDWYSKFPDAILDTIEIFFDRNEMFIGHISEDWNSKRIRRQFPVWGLVRTVAPAEMALTPGIQAADMMAWAGHRLAPKSVKSDGILIAPKTYLFKNTDDRFSRIATDIFNGPAGWHVLLDEYILATRRFPEEGARKLLSPARKPLRV